MKKLHSIHRSTDLHWVGNGFPVRSVFSYMEQGRELDPFLLLDYAEPYDFPPSNTANETRGVGAHPHRGFETVTIVYQGELEHRDSSGGGGKIGPGDVQWMTAAGGLLHEEFHSPEFVKSGGTFQVAQLWVNLPARDKDAPPGYQTLLAAQIPTVPLPDDAGTVRVIAGEFIGRSGPAVTFTPINLWDIALKAGKFAQLLVPEGHTTALLIQHGAVRVEEKEGKEGDLLIFERRGTDVVLHATEDTRILLMGGEPINEPIAGRGPFVMNTQEELFKAYEDTRNGKFGRL